VETGKRITQNDKGHIQIDRIGYFGNALSDGMLKKFCDLTIYKVVANVVCCPLAQKTLKNHSGGFLR